MTKREAVLRRWSRRKLAAQRRPRQAEAKRPASREPEAEAPALREPSRPPEPEAAELPSTDSLDSASDFSAFMQEDVPQPLRTAALRRLWTLDPAFNRLDGLVEYGDDYRASSAASELVRTAWQLGKGMADQATTPPEDSRPGGEAPADRAREAGAEAADTPSEAEKP